MEVTIHSTNQDHLLKFVVIAARYQQDWIMVKHRERSTWEIPGGHIEPGETPDAAASRELIEETGAAEFELTPVGDYCVTRKEEKSYGRLYFAEIKTLGELPPSEIECIGALHADMVWTYEAIQPVLFEGIYQFLEETA